MILEGLCVKQGFFASPVCVTGSLACHACELSWGRRLSPDKLAEAKVGRMTVTREWKQDRLRKPEFEQEANAVGRLGLAQQGLGVEMHLADVPVAGGRLHSDNFSRRSICPVLAQ